jgi:hypothetical protein
MMIPYPPQRRIAIPLRNDRLSPWFDEAEAPPQYVSIKIREFELRDFIGGPYGTAEYAEVL